MKKGKFKIITILSTLVLSFCGLAHVNHINNVDAAEGTTPTEYKIVNNYNYRLSKSFDKSPDTIEAWVKLPHSSTGGTIISNINACSAYDDMSFGVDSLGRLTFRWHWRVFDHVVENVHVNDNQWHHVAYVRNKASGEFIFYIDGIEVDRVKSYQKDVLCDIPFNIGVGYENFYERKTPFDGTIRQLTVYNNALSVAEIKKDMENENIVSTETNKLLGNWVFGEDWTERYIQDTSDNDNDAYIATHEKYVGVYDAGEYDYTLVVVPDIQIMTNYNVPRLRSQTQWIIDNKEELNIEHVMYAGDLSDKGPEEILYVRASEALSMMDGKVDYCVVAGNHDYNDNFNANTRDTRFFNTYFPASKHSQMPTFGGLYEENKMENSYYLFEAGEAEYVVINLEFRPRIEVLRWANTICEKYSNRRVIVVSHTLVGPDGNFTDAHTKLVEKHLLMKQPNMFMSFSGHISTDDIVMRRDIGEHGNTVTSILVDSQGCYYQGVGGLDNLLLLKFNEEKKTIQLVYYSPEYDACYNIQNQFTISFADENNPTVL